MRPILAVAVVALAALACSSKDQPSTASAEPVALSSSSATVPAPGPSGSAAAVNAGPRGVDLIVQASFPESTRITALERALIACSEQCMTGTTKPASVETTIVDRSGSKKHELFPEAAWRSTYGPQQGSIFYKPHTVTFHGSYPENLWATLDAPFDRGGYGSVVALRAGSNGWEVAAGDLSPPDPWVCHLGASAREFLQGRHCGDGGLVEPARKLLPLLSRAKTKLGRFAVLSDGTGVLLTELGYTRLGPAGELQKDAPWVKRPEEVVALVNGAFVVTSEDGVFHVAPDDKVTPVVLKVAATPEAQPIKEAKRYRLQPVGSEVWVTFVHDSKVKVAARPADSPWKRHLPPRPSRDEPAETRPPHQLPHPVKHTDACTTPFVMLASNSSKHYTFSSSVSAFYKHQDLQDALTFVQITRDQTSYFGVQTKTLEQAKLAMELAEAIELKPQLTCFDAVSGIPDPTSPPGGVRVYFANLGQSELIWP